MGTQTQTRIIGMTGHIMLEQGGQQSITVYRDLMIEEDLNGSWLVYARSCLQQSMRRVRTRYRGQSASRTKQPSNSSAISFP